jgi:putative tryptophan/tyrosine transport system substrate-binding protein
LRLQGAGAITKEHGHRVVVRVLQSLRKLGWTDDRNIRIDYRWVGAQADRIRAQAIELVSLKPDVILTIGTRRPAQRAPG